MLHVVEMSQVSYKLGLFRDSQRCREGLIPLGGLHPWSGLRSPPFSLAFTWLSGS